MGTLRVVATPIGNLEDVSLRALRVLREADLLLAEDTRHTRVLLERHEIAARPRSLHAHNEAERSAEVLAALAGGENVVLVSDAGTPLVSDPGERLVAAALAAGHRVEPVPGASAVLAALVASGLPAVPFHFEGFLSRKAGERARRLETLAVERATLVFFESPQRVAATLAELAQALGPRRAALARELTKRHEEVAHGSLPELAERFAEGARGEVTLVVEGAASADSGPPPDADLDAAIRQLLEAGLGPRVLARALAAATGVSRRTLYERALALRGDK